MFYVTITAPGFESFQGDFCGYDFKDGTSVEAVPRKTADRMGSIFAVTLKDADGNDLGQGGAATRIAEGRHVVSDPNAVLTRMTDEEHAAENKRAVEDGGKAPSVFYTESQLSAVADKEGIEALRVIAKPWNVKDRSIPRLIQRILKAQSDFTARQEERAEELRVSRAKAAVDAKAIQDGIEADIDAKSRLTKEAAAEVAAAAEQTTSPLVVSLELKAETGEVVITDPVSGEILQSAKLEDQAEPTADVPPVDNAVEQV